MLRLHLAVVLSTLVGCSTEPISNLPDAPDRTSKSSASPAADPVNLPTRIADKSVSPPAMLLFSYELRAPKNATFDPQTTFELASKNGGDGYPLRATRRRDDDKYAVFDTKGVIRSGEPRRAMIVSIPGKPSQIFHLDIPVDPQPATWTAWQRPDYTVTPDVRLNYLHGTVDRDRSTNIPSDSFELRYEITPWPTRP